MTKRILIIDHCGDCEQKKLFPENNEVIVVDNFTDAFKHLEVKYGKSWKELWKEYPVPPTPCQAPHMKRADKMHTARWNSKLPYWDAVLTDLCDKDNINGNQVGFGVGFLAAIARVPYVAIIGRNLPRTSGGCQVSNIFQWLPPLPVYHQWFIPVGNRKIYFGNSNDYGNHNRELWNHHLITTILANSPEEKDTTGLPIALGVVPMTDQKRDQKKIVEEIWPGLIEKY